MRLTSNLRPVEAASGSCPVRSNIDLSLLAVADALAFQFRLHVALPAMVAV
jgi:hypothetical protein